MNFAKYPKTMNFVNLCCNSIIGTTLCNELNLYINRELYRSQKDHIVTTLKTPSNQIIKLLAERHIKNDFETKECNKIIFNNNIKNILFENSKSSPLNLYFTYPLELKTIRLPKDIKDTIKNKSSINDAINSKKHKYYDLEYNSKNHFSDNVQFICESIINLTPFMLFSRPTYAMKIMSCVFLYDIANTLTINMDYKTKSLLSKYLFFDTFIYRRDKEMAINIIKYMDDNTINNDVLCIFGYLHNEGICHYLLQHDYKIVEQSRF
jgi:hypothetical protein